MSIFVQKFKTGHVEPVQRPPFAIAYRIIIAILSKNFSLSLSDWYQLHLTDHPSFYNYQANSDYLTLLSPIAIN